jgi:hypothetical protein
MLNNKYYNRIERIFYSGLVSWYISSIIIIFLIIFSSAFKIIDNSNWCNKSYYNETTTLMACSPRIMIKPEIIPVFVIVFILVFIIYFSRLRKVNSLQNVLHLFMLVISLLLLIVLIIFKLLGVF